MSRTNSQNGWKATADYSDIDVSEGDVLSRAPEQAAYFKLVYKEANEEECTLSADEVIDTFNKQDLSGLTQEDAEEQIVEAMHARQHGLVGDDVTPQIDISAAVARKADAYSYGAKLPKEFTEHVRRSIESNQFRRMGCVFCADDIAGRLYNNHDSRDRNWKHTGPWSKEEILAMPVPGSKPKKGEVLSSNQQNKYDIYKYEASDGTKISSSWYLDAVVASPEGATLLEEKQQLIEHKQQSPTGASDEVKKKLESVDQELKDAATFLRDGVTVIKAILEFERLNGKIIWEMQRDDDGVPAIRSKRPLRIWPQGQSGKAESFTLSNMRTMLKLDSNGDNAIDRTIANGGNWEAWTAKGLPPKKKGKSKTAHVSTPNEWLNWQDACAVYVQRAGIDGLLRLLMDKDMNVREGNVASFGLMMTTVLPIWERPDIQAVWQEYRAKKRKADADAIARKHNKVA